MRLQLLAFTFWLIAPAFALAELSVPAFFSDHMVLQRDRAASIWGTATPDAKVVVEFKGQTANAKADDDGRWRVGIATGAADASGETLTVRSGAESVKIVYRRSREEMPARAAEIHHAEEEGIEMFLLTNPTKYLGNEKGRLTGMVCLQMELGEPDASGRRRPVPVEGSEYILDIDYAIVAIGNGSNPIIQQTSPDLEFNKRGNIVADAETMQTNLPGVYAGGDIVTGGATVILAMGDGKRIAAAINHFLTE